MENLSLFERLADRLSEYGARNSGKETDSLDVEGVMDTAGEVLFHGILSEEIYLGDIPSWFRIEPKGIRIGDNGKGGSKDFVVHSWGLYWLYTIKWLAKNKPTSGITFPGDIRCVKPERYLQAGRCVGEFLISICGLRGKSEKRAWRELAKASEDACIYLAETDPRQGKIGFLEELTPEEPSESE